MALSRKQSAVPAQATILTHFRIAGDAHIGQTLMRLARLAEAAHRFESVRQLNAKADAELCPSPGPGRPQGHGRPCPAASDAPEPPEVPEAAR